MKKQIQTILSFGIVIVLTILFVTFVAQRTVVEGSSMRNTLKDGDNLLVEKVSYRFRKPHRFDVVIVPKEEGSRYYLIKRVIGLPGETVQVKDGAVYINGARLKDTYGREPMQDPGLFSEPVKLGKDEYFVLGDNRNYSTDSRFIGPVKGKDMIGRAVFRLYPNPRTL